MPKREDVSTILVIGSGPIVIGQASEFDYSGSQALKALREEGYRTILVNSNPASIQTDPALADRTYIEPLTPQSLRRIIELERPDALLASMGGQVALNLATALSADSTLERFGVELLGSTLASIERGEDREKFAAIVDELGLSMCASHVAKSVEEALLATDTLGYPVVVRPSYTLGGAGGGLAHNAQELSDIAEKGLHLSSVNELLIEESIAGWKEIEIEAMRDSVGNGIIICSIENIDPMGIHTGDSICVAPAQTLTNVELQYLRDASLAILEKVGVSCGGSNVQFAINPKDGRVVVIEMNPRVSRSSALASKATGFPIAKVAAQLAVGYTLDELKNDITKTTSAAFEPALDYCVVKAPRFAFEKFCGADKHLGTRMKSVGEVMAQATYFEEALQKVLRSLEFGHFGICFDKSFSDIEARFAAALEDGSYTELLAHADADRIYYVAEALKCGLDSLHIAELTHIDLWFIEKIAHIVRAGQMLFGKTLDGLSREDLLSYKCLGYSDEQLAYLLSCAPEDVLTKRERLDIHPIKQTVDTCAGEFRALTQYHFLSYRPSVDGNLLGTNYPDFEEVEAIANDKPKVIILSAGPNRIGQGVEFDYCCVHAAKELQLMGYKSIMINCNPETVSTDYDRSDVLYFAPLCLEDVLEIVRLEKPFGVICSLGGQTPVNLARSLQAFGVPLLGTLPSAIDEAEDRERFSERLITLGLQFPRASSATNVSEALHAADSVGYPLLVRPSYVLGGRGMAIVYTQDELASYMERACKISPEAPIYLDSYLEDAIEVDVDGIADKTGDIYIATILEHIEECGIHSGDSACCWPPYSISEVVQARIAAICKKLVRSLHIQGPFNIQLALRAGEIYIIELNPRASRSLPFSAKATGLTLCAAALRACMGETIAEMVQSGLLTAEDKHKRPNYFAVKEAVMPWARFEGADMLLGPEMKSTGEVMGLSKTFPLAYAKTRFAIEYELPKAGAVFISVCDSDKRAVGPIAKAFELLGYDLYATRGTAKSLSALGMHPKELLRIHEGHPHVLDLIDEGKLSYIVNTPSGHTSRGDGIALRSAAIAKGISMTTALSGATALIQALYSLKDTPEIEPIALQDLS